MTVVRLAQNHMAFTNSIYCSPSCSLVADGFTHVTINNIVFIIEAHSAVDDGHVALGLMHRQTVHCALGDVVAVERVKFPVTVHDVASLIEIKYQLASSHGLFNREDMDSAVARVVAERCHGMPLSKNQDLVIEYNGVVLALRVVQVQRFTSGTEKFGILHNTITGLDVGEILGIVKLTKKFTTPSPVCRVEWRPTPQF